MMNRFVNTQKQILGGLKYQVFGGLGFVTGILSSYYVLVNYLEEDKAKNIASAIGVLGYSLMSYLAVRLQKRSYVEAVAQSSEVAMFVGTSMGSQILFEHLGWSFMATLLSSQCIGVVNYALAAFAWHRLTKHWANQGQATHVAAKQTTSQMVEILAFCIGTTTMNAFKMPVYATYLVGFSMFSLAAWAKATLTYQPEEHGQPYIRV